MQTKKSSIDHITKTLEPLYNNQTKYPTTLFELSPSQYDRITNTSIHLTGLSITASPCRKEHNIIYSLAKYGSNIKSCTKWVNIGKKTV